MKRIHCEKKQEQQTLKEQEEHHHMLETVGSSFVHIF
jgi:hypothetical protein